MSTQPEALRLADALEDSLEDYSGSSLPRRCQNIADEAAAELRRLHEVEQQRDLFARWMFMRGNHSGDWACAQCRPNSDILVPGFVCAFHQAEVIARRPPSDLADAPRSNGYITPEQLAKAMMTFQLPQGAIGAMVSRNGSTAKFYPVEHLPADDTEGGAA